MTYNIKLVSLANSAIFVILILTIWLTFGIIFIPPQGFPDPNASLLFIPVIFYITYLLWQKFVTGRTAWAIDDNEIKLHGQKTFS